MNAIKSLIEAKQFTVDLMLANPTLFGTKLEVKRKIDFLRFEIMQLNLKLDAWH